MSPEPGHDAGPRALRDALRRDLASAMKAREPDAVSALRTAIAAIDNAEAVPAPDERAATTSGHIAGARAGLGAAEAAGLARHDALVHVPGEGPPALIALLARSADVLDPAQGRGPLAFLGRAVAAALGR